MEKSLGAFADSDHLILVFKGRFVFNIKTLAVEEDFSSPYSVPLGFLCSLLLMVVLSTKISGGMECHRNLHIEATPISRQGCLP